MTSARRVPNLLVPGTQKSGTTYLCAHLARHPKVYFSRPKEPHFFNKEGITNADFELYLARHFSGGASRTAVEPTYVAEGSTTYFQRRPALDNVLHYLGREVKAIVCLRHPVEKALSFYLHNWRRGRLRGSERLMHVDEGGVSVLKTTICAPHAQRWIGALGAERILFLRYDLLRQDPAAFVRQATDFLGLRPLKRVDSRKINVGFALMREDERFLPVISPSEVGDGQVVPHFTLEELEQALKHFSEDIAQTEKITGLDLSEWKRMPAFPGAGDAGQRT